MGLYLKDTIEGTCRKAISDENGNSIAETYLKKTGDSKDSTVSFTSADSLSPAAWTDAPLLATGEKHSSIFNKISTMFKNIRWLYKMLGTTDIASIGGGTLTGAISKLNTDLEDFKKVSSYSVTEPEIDSILTVVDTWTLIFFKFGRLVAARANFRAEMEPHDGSYLLGTVPKEFSPLYPVTFIHNTQIYGKRMIVDINMDGSVKVHNLGEKIPRDWVGRWTVTYISQK